MEEMSDDFDALKPEAPLSDCKHEEVEDGICFRCGTVVSDFQIASNLEFGNFGKGKSSLLAGTRHNARDGTSVSCGGRMLYGTSENDHKFLSGPRRSTLQNVRKRIEKIANSDLPIELDDHILETANRCYRIAHSTKLVYGYPADLIAASCVYLACRLQKIPPALLLIDFADAISVNVFDLGKVFLKIARVMRLTQDNALNALDPLFLIQRFCKQLFSCRGTQRNSINLTAQRIFRRMKLDRMDSGRQPAGLCAASLFIASRIHGQDITINSLQKVAKVAGTTVVKRLNEFSRLPAASITKEQLKVPDSLESIRRHLPPSFIRNRLLELAKKLQREEEAKLEAVEPKQVIFIKSESERETRRPSTEKTIMIENNKAMPYKVSDITGEEGSSVFEREGSNCRKSNKATLGNDNFAAILSPDDYLAATVFDQTEEQTGENDADDILLDDSIDIDIDDWKAIDEEVAFEKAKTVYKKHFDVLNGIDNDVKKNDWNLEDITFSASCSTSQTTSPNEKSSNDASLTKNYEQEDEQEDSITEFENDPEIRDMLGLTESELLQKEKVFEIIYPYFDQKQKLRESRRVARKRKQKDMEAVKNDHLRKKKRMYSKTVSEMKEQMMGGELLRLQRILEAKDKVREREEEDTAVFGLNAAEVDDFDFDDELFNEDEDVVQGSLVNDREEEPMTFAVKVGKSRIDFSLESSLPLQISLTKTESPEKKPILDDLIKEEDIFDDDEFLY